MRPIELRFGTPVHGWLDVELSGPGGRAFVDASDVPGDSLSMLACAVCAVVDGYPEGKVTWFLEPAEAIWIFRRVGDEIRVLVSMDGRDLEEIAAGKVEEIGLAVWRALRRLEVDPAWTDADQDRVWSHPFPHKDTAQLGQKLGRG